jgi:hypothetical protein
LLKSPSRFAKVASNQAVITYHKKWHSKLGCESLSHACFAGAGRANEQKRMARFERMRSKERRLSDLLNKFLDLGVYSTIEHKIGETPARRNLVQQALQTIRQHGRANSHELGGGCFCCASLQSRSNPMFLLEMSFFQKRCHCVLQRLGIITRLAPKPANAPLLVHIPYPASDTRREISQTARFLRGTGLKLERSRRFAQAFGALAG